MGRNNDVVHVMSHFTHWVAAVCLEKLTAADFPCVGEGLGLLFVEWSGGAPPRALALNADTLDLICIT